MAITVSYEKLRKMIEREFLVHNRVEEKQDHWYDYENQKALRFPPVGVVCLVLDNVEAKIIGTTHYGYLVYQNVETGFCGMACQPSSFKPLDWSKHRAAEVNELTDILVRNNVFAFSAADCAKAILAAGYRKCDN